MKTYETPMKTYIKPMKTYEEVAARLRAWRTCADNCFTPKQCDEEARARVAQVADHQF